LKGEKNRITEGCLEGKEGSLRKKDWMESAKKPLGDQGKYFQPYKHKILC
jgi:hypothetical protein